MMYVDHPAQGILNMTLRFPGYYAQLGESMPQEQPQLTGTSYRTKLFFGHEGNGVEVSIMPQWITGRILIPSKVIPVLHTCAKREVGALLGTPALEEFCELLEAEAVGPSIEFNKSDGFDVADGMYRVFDTQYTIPGTVGDNRMWSGLERIAVRSTKAGIPPELIDAALASDGIGVVNSTTGSTLAQALQRMNYVQRNKRLLTALAQ